MNGKKEFGDYQTPVPFAREVCELLSKKYAVNPQIIIEPTCGVGNFLQESLVFNAELYYGIDINENYCDVCREKFANTSNVTIYNNNIFSFDLRCVLCPDEETLVIGNPPWITNSELSKNSSSNLPIKSNIKSLNGLNAITGASNFDICEYIVLHIIECVQNEKAVVAMLCKNSVARNIFIEINRRNIKYTSFSLYNFNAKKIFSISASACLLVIDFRDSANTHLPCIEFNVETPFVENNIFEYSGNGITVSGCGDDFSGKCCFEWRQGVKHDCSQVMELKRSGHCYINGMGEEVDIENDFVFPLIKSSMIKKPVITSSSKYVIVTQTKIKENTERINNIAPKTWEYLSNNKNRLDNRKSSIYKNAPAFSMFGIGSYSFAKYKVAVSGFYKVPLFSLIYSNDKTVMCDDTSYFITFSDYDEAYSAMLVLNSSRVRNYLQTVSFQDAKRPFTKQLLDKIDFKAILNSITFEDVVDTEKICGLSPYIDTLHFNNFRESVYLMSGS